MKAVANGFLLGKNNYFSDNWNRLDGTLVLISLVDGVIRMVAGIMISTVLVELQTKVREDFTIINQKVSTRAFFAS